MKRTLLFLAIFFTFTQVQAQTITWTGVVNTDWNVGTNWSTFVVPTTTDEVDIPSGFTVDFSGTATVQRIMQNGSAKLNIAAGSTLTINAALASGMALQHSGGSCETTNDGTLEILNAAHEGVLSKGTWTNNGTLTINNSAEHNIRVQGGNFTNGLNANLNITLDNTSGDEDGLAVDDNGGTGSTFTNLGTVNITMISGDEGIDITDGSELINYKDIIITASGADMGMKVRKTGSKLTNNMGGTVFITGTLDRAISIEEGAQVDNNSGATIECSSSAEHGVDVKDGTFNNNAGALYKAIATKDGVYVRAAGQVNNSGDMWLDLCTSEEIEMALGVPPGNFSNTSTATFHPGSSPGQMEIKYDFDFGASVVTFEINGTTAESDYDQIDKFGNSGSGISSNVTISGATAHLDWGTFIPAVGNCFKIIDGSGELIGAWASVTDSNPGIIYTVTYPDNDGLVAAPDECEICVTAVVVPVELARFSGEKTESGSESKLSWVTATEVNNEGFDIERSNDGLNWSAIGFVEGNGNSFESIEYNYIDESPRKGSNYYRLKQNDYDGNFDYSHIVSLNFRDVNRDFTFYPNPVSDVLYLDVVGEEDDIETQVLDSNGKLLWTKKGTVTQIPFADFKPGIYFLNVTSPTEQVVKKVIRI